MAVRLIQSMSCEVMKIVAARARGGDPARSVLARLHNFEIDGSAERIHA